MHGNTENLVIPNGNTEFPKFLIPENCSEKMNILPVLECQFPVLDFLIQLRCDPLQNINLTKNIYLWLDE